MFDDIMGKKEYDRFDLACLYVIKTLNQINSILIVVLFLITDLLNNLVRWSVNIFAN